MELKLFVDFDGTITRRDVGNALFRSFGGEPAERLIGEFLAEGIEARPFYRALAETMGRFTIAAFDGFIDAEEIDGSFRSLVGWCSSAGVELKILSDGLDYYIRRILRREDLMAVEFYSNALTFIDPQTDGSRRAVISFPHGDAECTRCACCKRNLMLTHAGEQDILCYIGNGSSDRCPARYADIVFAKEDLQAYCQKENISYFPYASFDDVIARLGDLAARSLLRPRRRAWENRRALFMRES